MKHVPGMQVCKYFAPRAIHPKRSTLEKRLQRNPIAGRDVSHVRCVAVELALVPPKETENSSTRNARREDGVRAFELQRLSVTSSLRRSL